MRALTFCICLLIAGLAGGASAAEQVAVIAHPSVPQQPLDAPTLLDIYTGQVKTWKNGAPIVLVDLKEKTDVKRAFYGYLGMSSSRMKSIWMKNLLAGEGRPPESILDEDALLDRIASTPGALGYVSLSRARQNAGVHILLEISDDKK